MNNVRGHLLLLAIVFLIITFNVPAEEYFFSHNFAFTVTDGADILVEDGTATLFMTFSDSEQCRRWCWQEFTQEDLNYGSDGYARLHLFERDFTVILGGNHFFFQPDMYAKEVGRLSEVYDFNIESIVPSSVYTEEIGGKTVTYSAKDLMQRFTRDSLGIERLWHNNLLPWVEGVEGPGVGETLDITFTKPMDHMVILNGFVDPGRKYLYKANSRVKRARIHSNDPEFSFEFVFKDRVQFSHISFPEATEHVTFEIVETYNGERWQDTAISAVMTNHSWGRYEKGSIQRMKKTENKYIPKK